MRIALAQINYYVGNFEFNTQKALDALKKAKQQNVDLVVFSELAISGYPPRDFLEFDDFIKKCRQSIEKIAAECVGVAAIIGAPVANPAHKGKKLFNAAAFLNNGTVVSYRYKSLLPTYDVFDEYRYFEPNQHFETITFQGKKLAVTICEDLWDVDEDVLYREGPMQQLFDQHPDLIINIAASPFSYKQPARRKRVLRTNVTSYQLPLVYVNHVGAQTELLFDGDSLVMGLEESNEYSLALFEEDFAVFDLENGAFTPITAVVERKEYSEIELIHDALVMGVKNYFQKLGFTKAILGLSGGIDSAVTMVLAAEALDADNVLGVLLPSQFSSDHSIADAQQLAENLGSPYKIIPIKNIYQSFETELKPHFQGLPFNIAEENLQARARGVLLMALSNKFGYIVLNTSNKSEAAVGYGTLYGDMCGGISVLGDVYKIQVFELAKYINRDHEIIPVNTITKPPSAELRPDQKDSDSLPDYNVLDEILLQYIENRKGPAEIIAMGFDEATVKRTLRMVNLNEYKRYQTPPILRVSPKAFGMGRRMPIVAKYLS